MEEQKLQTNSEIQKLIKESDIENLRKYLHQYQIEMDKNQTTESQNLDSNKINDTTYVNLLLYENYILLVKQADEFYGKKEYKNSILIFSNCLKSFVLVMDDSSYTKNKQEKILYKLKLEIYEKLSNTLYTIGESEDAFENLAHSLNFDLNRNFKKFSHLYLLFAENLFNKLNYVGSLKILYQLKIFLEEDLVLKNNDDVTIPPDYDKETSFTREKISNLISTCEGKLAKVENCKIDENHSKEIIFESDEKIAIKNTNSTSSSFSSSKIRKILDKKFQTINGGNRLNATLSKNILPLPLEKKKTSNFNLTKLSLPTIPFKYKTPSQFELKKENQRIGRLEIPKLINTNPRINSSQDKKELASANFFEHNSIDLKTNSRSGSISKSKLKKISSVDNSKAGSIIYKKKVEVSDSKLIYFLHKSQTVSESPLYRFQDLEVESERDRKRDKKPNKSVNDKDKTLAESSVDKLFQIKKSHYCAVSNSSKSDQKSSVNTTVNTTLPKRKLKPKIPKNENINLKPLKRECDISIIPNSMCDAYKSLEKINNYNKSPNSSANKDKQGKEQHQHQHQEQTSSLMNPFKNNKLFFKKLSMKISEKSLINLSDTEDKTGITGIIHNKSQNKKRNYSTGRRENYSQGFRSPKKSDLSEKINFSPENNSNISDDVKVNLPTNGNLNSSLCGKLNFLNDKFSLESIKKFRNKIAGANLKDFTLNNGEKKNKSLMIGQDLKFGKFIDSIQNFLLTNENFINFMQTIDGKIFSVALRIKKLFLINKENNFLCEFYLGKAAKVNNKTRIEFSVTLDKKIFNSNLEEFNKLIFILQNQKQIEASNEKNLRKFYYPFFKSYVKKLKKEFFLLGETETENENSLIKISIQNLGNKIKKNKNEQGKNLPEENLPKLIILYAKILLILKLKNTPAALDKENKKIKSISYKKDLQNFISKQNSSMIDSKLLENFETKKSTISF